MLDLVLQPDHARIEVRGRRHDAPEAAARLRGADDVEVLDLGRERAAVDLDDVVFDLDQALGQEREAVVEAGRSDDHVVFRGRAILEVDGVAVEARDLVARA